MVCCIKQPNCEYVLQLAKEKNKSVYKKTQVVFIFTHRSSYDLLFCPGASVGWRQFCQGDCTEQCA
jgi:hypothetical protein